MANKDAAFGFKPTRHLTGGLIRTEEYAIAANYGSAIYTGQVVEAVAAGGIEAAAAGDTQQLGVFAGVFYTDPTTSKPTFKPFYAAKIPESRVDEAFSWLRNRGYEDLIKNTITASFGRGQDNQVSELIKVCDDNGFAYNKKEKVKNTVTFTQMKIQKAQYMGWDLRMRQLQDQVLLRLSLIHI